MKDEGAFRVRRRIVTRLLLVADHRENMAIATRGALRTGYSTKCRLPKDGGRVSVSWGQSDRAEPATEG